MIPQNGPKMQENFETWKNRSRAKLQRAQRKTSLPQRKRVGGGGFQYIPLMWTGKGIREANEYNANLRRIILWYFWNSA